LVTDRARAPAALARATTTLLAYAARRLTFVARHDGSVHADVADPLAARILALPLVPAGHGAPFPAWRIVRRFAALAGVGVADPATRLIAELDPGAPPAVAAWIRASFVPGAVAHPASRGVPLVARQIPGGDPYALSRLLEWHLYELRGGNLPLRVWIDPLDDGTRFVRVGSASLTLDANDPLVRHALAQRWIEPTTLAWLLVGLQAFLERDASEAAIERERAFHLRLADALERAS
jgi:hypothetical protein